VVVVDNTHFCREQAEEEEEVDNAHFCGEQAEEKRRWTTPISVENKQKKKRRWTTPISVENKQKKKWTIAISVEKKKKKKKKKKWTFFLPTVCLLLFHSFPHFFFHCFRFRLTWHSIQILANVLLESVLFNFTCVGV